MKALVNGREAGSKEMGCALCGATWGNHHEEVEGERLFFCCDLCAAGFRRTVEEIKRRTGWDYIDEIQLVGNYHAGRTVTAISGGRSARFYVKFNEDAEIETFREE
ncbi:hypothetical protein GCM10007981_10540 [Thermocladium modestius]|uniref:TRASH domain-containing protein n=1 Tax=Thermocladium modestius TaxID=62609 RepID=A0A830GVC3_9CREN|nr:TA0938 family protein [Thermocladium modestius]GGP20840.1 hypothetical protein GCM10007981_10540 [Thermocladium modestius]